MEHPSAKRLSAMIVAVALATTTLSVSARAIAADADALAVAAPKNTPLRIGAYPESPAAPASNPGLPAPLSITNAMLISYAAAQKVAPASRFAVEVAPQVSGMNAVPAQETAENTAAQPEQSLNTPTAAAIYSDAVTPSADAASAATTELATGTVISAPEIAAVAEASPAISADAAAPVDIAATEHRPSFFGRIGNMLSASAEGALKALNIDLSETPVEVAETTLTADETLASQAATGTEDAAQSAAVEPAPYFAPAPVNKAADNPQPRTKEAAPIITVAVADLSPIAEPKKASASPARTSQEAMLSAAEALAALAPAATSPAEPAISPQPVTQAIQNTAESAAVSSEPAPTLTPTTRKTLARTPSGIDTPKKEKKEHIEVQRGVTAADVFGANEGEVPAESRSQASVRPMNIQVQTSKPALDSNQLLRNAYDALAAGNNEIAIREYELVLSSDAKNKQALFGLATTYHRVGQIEKARPLYVRLLAIDPKHREALNNFMALAAEESPQEALKQLVEMEEKNPGFSPIPAQMAVIYQKLGRPDEALDKMVRAVSLSPENLTYRYNLAVLFDRTGRFQEAAAIYQQLIEASVRGERIPGNVSSIQERLTYLRSNVS